MSPHTTLIDLAIGLTEDDGVGSATASDTPILSKFKRSQSQLFSASRKQHKKSKSVCYNKYDKVAEISHVTSFSQKKIDRLWYSSKEQSETRKECLELVGRFNAGKVMGKEVMFGLEKQTEVGLKPAKKLRRAVYKVVFSLQEAEHVTSLAARTSLIADFCERTCVKPALEARLSALKLALEVKTEFCLSNTIPKVKM
jgi:putative alpha-1,2-mannosidase